MKSGYNNQPSPTVLSLQTDISLKALAISLLVIENKCVTKEVKDVLLILKDSEFYVEDFNQEVKDILQSRAIASTVFNTCQHNTFHSNR